MSETKIVQNTIFRSGDSWVVSLPVKWRKKNKLKLGSKLFLAESKSGNELVMYKDSSSKETEDER